MISCVELSGTFLSLCVSSSLGVTLLTVVSSLEVDSLSGEASGFGTCTSTSESCVVDKWSVLSKPLRTSLHIGVL